MDFRINMGSTLRLGLILLVLISDSELITARRTYPVRKQLKRRDVPKHNDQPNTRSLQFNSPEAHFAGLIPVSSQPNETRKLFFWFWPAESELGEKDLTFWTNGGPGCSSLESLLQETGPTFPDILATRSGETSQEPIRLSEFSIAEQHLSGRTSSWNKLSSMLYVEQPVGTGYSEGAVQAHNETDISRGPFWVFPGMAQVTGESYAGRYIPYLADYIYSRQAGTRPPIAGYLYHRPRHRLTEIPAWPMVQRYESVFALNSTFTAELEDLHHRCGYADYIEKTCALWEKTCNNQRLTSDPIPNGDSHIFDTEPILWDVLSGAPGANQSWPGQTGDPTYFNRPEVKELLHVPTSTHWSECSDKDVIIGRDTSAPVSMSVLPGVIEKSKRTIIAHGMADYVLIAQGTRMAIQNMTWNGKQGFKKPITDDFLVKGQGTIGRWREERGLTYAEIELSGHMLPQYQPKSAYQLFKYLLGHTQSPSSSVV
ncbi:putative carboxypeptidase cpdS precursor [Melampsora americana]|nr:putative carboxypeptidase cpdS precursor [Melampsora americana]